MTRDLLATIVRLRQNAMNEARRVLAYCLTTEARHAAAFSAVDAQLQRELASVRSLDRSDSAVEVFAVWLAHYRTALGKARSDLDRSIAQTYLARAALSATQSALDAAEALHKLQQMQLQCDEIKKEQNVSDELVCQRNRTH